MTTLKIKDNSSTNKKYFNEVNQITKRISDKTLNQLEKEGVFIFPELIKEAKNITRDQMILQSVNDYYRSGNIMGFLGYGQERLVIESRFSNSEHDYFFQYLLENVLDFPSVLELNTDSNKDNKLINILMFLFPYYLNRAMRKGMFKTYIRNSYNDGNVKGTIDVDNHIKKNTPFTGNIAYSQREFSYDNFLIQLIRHTIEFIKRKPYGNNLLQKIKDEVSLVVQASKKYEYYDRRKIIGENKQSPIRHAYYHEYGTLQRLSIMILQQDKYQIGSGINQTHGIVFDGAWLWEEYMNTLIGDSFYHPMNKGGKGSQRLFENNIGLIYPDFISRDKENQVVADAKYKPIGNIGNKDYLQVLAYMFRFDAKKGFYLYPEPGEEKDIELRMNRGSTYEDNVEPREDIKVVKCGLNIPNDIRDYKEFTDKIKIAETIFIAKLGKLCK